MTEPWRGARVLVAGANGFIGSSLVKELLRRGAVVTAGVRRLSTSVRSGDVFAGATVALVDCTDLSQANSVIEGQQHVFIAAALDGNAEFKRQRSAHIFRTNSMITMNLLEASRVNGVSSVTYLSSAEVYANSDAERLTESMETGDTSSPKYNSYALAKLFGEVASRMYHREYGLPVAIARPTNVYGPGDSVDPQRGRVIAQWVSAGLAGMPIRVWGSGAEVRSFVFIDDLVDGLLLLAETYSRAVPVNLAGPEEISLLSLAHMVKGLGNFDSDIEFVAGAPAGPLRRVLDISRAHEALGYRPAVGMELGLTRTIASAKRTQPEAVLGT